MIERSRTTAWESGPDRTFVDLSIEFSSLRENMDRAGTVIQACDSPASTVGERYFFSLGLPRARLTTQLPDRLAHLGDTSCAHRVTTGLQPTAGIYRYTAGDLRLASVDQVLGLTLSAETKRLVVQDLGDREGVGTFRQADVLRAEPRLL